MPGLLWANAGRRPSTRSWFRSRSPRCRRRGCVDQLARVIDLLPDNALRHAALLHVIAPRRRLRSVERSFQSCRGRQRFLILIQRLGDRWRALKKQLKISKSGVTWAGI